MNPKPDEYESALVSSFSDAAKLTTHQSGIQQFVTWLREVAPYIHRHRNKTLVIGFDAELVKLGLMNALIQDIALLQAMGMHIVLVHGLRPQIEEQLILRQTQSQFAKGIRITDTVALECAKEAAGELRLDIEACFSQGLPNTPMSGSAISVVSGNFITARPVGIVDGIDYQHSGRVRKIDEAAIKGLLQQEKIILLSPLGFSPTGQAFNLDMEDVATHVAMVLKASKLVFITEFEGIVVDRSEYLSGATQKLHESQITSPHLIQELSLESAEDLLQETALAPDLSAYLEYAIKGIKGGVDRAHIIPFKIDGSVLLELFLHDGIGTMITNQGLEYLREANVDDIGAIVQLIEPLENDGTLVARGRHVIERDINSFSVIEHDGVIFGCAAMYLFNVEKMAEMACLTVLPEAQGMGDGDRLLQHVEKRAKRLGMEQLFVLTTRTEHWFLKRGFRHARPEELPKSRQEHYNWKRKSMVLIKKI
jgi:amino-acid N-acetyltransferase